MGNLVAVRCYSCKRKFFKDKRHVNENKKLGHNFYCSQKCQSKVKDKQIYLICENPECKRQFRRSPHEISPHNYCSRPCAASVNNSKYPKRHALVKKCLICDKDFISREKYCSLKCKHESQIITKKEIIKLIQNFHKKEGRIPLKREFHNYHASRLRFGTWNEAVKAAGFEPNPVMFAKKYFANDGHKCDSLAEKVIDDWLNFRKIKHERCIPYPGNASLTADFLVGDYWIEFFGLFGEHQRYDELRLEKLKLAKKFGLKFAGIYPKDLFPENQLHAILSPILKI